MTQGHACLSWLPVITALIWASSSSGVSGSEVRTATACYGNVNNYLRLDCENGAVISVQKVILGAKTKSAKCVSPASLETYNKSCCLLHPDDCTLIVQNAAISQCNNQESCDALATWSTTTKECDQDVYPATTTYMFMAYTCVGGTATPKPDTDGTGSGIESSVVPQTNPAPPVTIPPNDKTTKTAVAHHVQGQTAGDGEELSDTMVGAIVAGSVGMLLTFVAFVFYWGRKRRLRIVSKPQPTVWDYLLNQTFTVRGARGYDQFPSVRSSASSDGEGNSPVTNMRRNTWLPNIAPQDADDNDDATSVYENDNSRSHRVEVHPDAQPSPYAILNLEVNMDMNNINQNTHHEA